MLTSRECLCSKENVLKTAYWHPLMWLFSSTGGCMLGMTVYKINKLLSLESIPVYGNPVDLGQTCTNKLHKTAILCSC